MSRTKQFYIIFTLCILLSAKAERNFKIVFKGAKCEILSSKMKSLDCYASNSSNRSTITVNFQVSEDLPNIEAYVKLTMLRKNQRSYNLVDTKVDVCELLKLGSKRGIMQIFLKEVKNAGVNLDKGCPLRRNTDYGLRDYYMNADFFPLYTPELQFTVMVEFFNKDEKYARYRANGSVCHTPKSCA